LAQNCPVGVEECPAGDRNRLVVASINTIARRTKQK
jgi:hypothetical protein